jgi:hypothetical protein
MTSSAPALQGALDHAKQWASGHPDHTTVVVFATDGLPTVCLKDDVETIAKQGNPSVRKSVVGVGDSTWSTLPRPTRRAPCTTWLTPPSAMPPPVVGITMSIPPK